MKHVYVLALAIALPACSSDDSNAGDGGGGGGTDSSTVEDTSTPPDAGLTLDTGVRPDGGSAPDGGDAAADSGAELDASDGACPSSWFEAPTVNPSIGVPDGGGGVLLHAGGNGTQNYICAATTTDAGTTYAWTLVTPDATLSDCHEMVIGHHFASEAGAAFPEWQTLDGTYVVGSKHLPTFTPDGGSGSIPWLLLHAVDAGGAGTLSQTQYIQRLNTDGGNAPADVCNAGSVGTAKNVPYTADYFFFGP